MRKRAPVTVMIAAALVVSCVACGNKRSAVTPPPPPASAEAKVVAPLHAPGEQPAPRITAFTAEPGVIQRGQSVLLRWSVEDATDISIDQSVGPVQAVSSREVLPTATSTYILTAKSNGGTDSRSVTVEVATPVPPPPQRSASSVVSSGELFERETQDIYFDYDKTDIRDDARLVLTREADLLKRIFASDPRFTVAVEGHCDERGSAEYNLGLGDRRATAAEDFLVQLGIPADRVRTISYGKDRPVCTDANEGCYQRNRRAHLAPAH